MEKYRDGLFRDYFNDKVRLLDLCNVLLGTDGKNPNEIIIDESAKNYFGEIKDDVACEYRDRFIWLVHQTKLYRYTPYYAMMRYAECLRKKYTLEDLESDVPIRPPAPIFFIFYNGDEEKPAQHQIKLSDITTSESDAESIVDVYNINAGFNENLIGASEYLTNYCTFVNRVKKNLAAGMGIEHAISETIGYCINHNIMADYFSVDRGKITENLVYEFTVIKNMYEEEFEDE